MKREKLKLPDYYKILNLNFACSPEEIKNSYRKLAKLYHPDNRMTGSGEKFFEIHMAYKTLTGKNKERYDEYYIREFISPSPPPSTTKPKAGNLSTPGIIQLPPGRIVYTSSMADLARMGLLRSGMRTRDRKKHTGLYHDLEIMINEKERKHKVLVSIPLTVRILCPSCLGSDIYCESCNGIGTYKSTRSLHLAFAPTLLEQGKVYNLELSKYRPDKFIHFKKKNLKVRIHLFE
ncbi:MAG: DnaJ domain-containing protein [Leptospiraceae bacterium]|nr:DnaJ domain-containing protein [Leptospiraceae bacterium]MCP5512225.1 DnaJ domain-containing protein [Leptospiraceae bacterium]